MPRTNPLLEDRNDAMERVALLFAEGLSQSEISTRLKISQSVVSELLAEAQKSGIIDCRPMLLLSDEKQEFIRKKVYMHDLSSRLKEFAKAKSLKLVPEVHVCFSDSELDRLKSDPPMIWDAAVADWGPRVAPFVRKLLQNCSLVGITWGRQCRAVVDGIGRLYNQPNSKPVEVLPLWCPRLIDQPETDDSIFSDQLKLSSNSLAADLRIALNSTRKNLKQYMLPGFDLIPFRDITDFERDLKTSRERKDDQERLQDVVKIYNASPAYVRIFGQRNDTGVSDIYAENDSALIWQLDAIVTSVGPAGTSRAFGRSQESYGGVPQSFFEQETIGDVGGILLPKRQPPLTELSRDTSEARIGRQFERLRQRWMGVQETHLRRCASKSPGVIALAVGANRAKVLFHGLILRELANYLIIDQACATALEQLIDASLK